VVASAAGLVTVALAFAAVAQPRQNIAGTYRGLMTGCLTAPQPGACRKGLAEIVRLADEVDAKYAVWAQTDGTADSARADLLHKEYALAVDELNRSVRNFNRDMKVQASDADQKSGQED
jgi:hypothetical protein